MHAMKKDKEKQNIKDDDDGEKEIDEDLEQDECVSEQLDEDAVVGAGPQNDRLMLSKSRNTYGMVHGTVKTGLGKALKDRKLAINKWKAYVQTLSDSLVAICTFLGGSAFVGVTLAITNNDRALFDTIIVCEVSGHLIIFCVT